jgi:hypothetical protein
MSASPNNTSQSLPTRIVFPARRRATGGCPQTDFGTVPGPAAPLLSNLSTAPTSPESAACNLSLSKNNSIGEQRVKTLLLRFFLPASRFQLPASGFRLPICYTQTCCQHALSDQDHHAQTQNASGRGQALQKNRLGQIQARPVQNAAHPYLEGNQNQAPPRQERPGFRRRPQEGRPHDSLRLILPGRSRQRLPSRINAKSGSDQPSE